MDFEGSAVTICTASQMLLEIEQDDSHNMLLEQDDSQLLLIEQDDSRMLLEQDDSRMLLERDDSRSTNLNSQYSNKTTMQCCHI